MSGQDEYNEAMIMATDKVRHLRYEKLRQRLQEIPYWPHRYCHKIIGKNAEAFREGIEAFENQFPSIQKKTENESKRGNYLSLTYELQAETADEIISLWVASEEIEDCLKIL